MKHKFKSMLAGMLSLALLPVLPMEGTALEWSSVSTSVDAVVVGMSEDHCILARQSGETYKIFTESEMFPLLPDGAEKLVLGDTVVFHDGWCAVVNGRGKTGEMSPMLTPEPGEGMLHKTGSVLDEGETALFTVTEISDWCRLTDGNTIYNIYTDWMDSDYEQLGNVDWSAVEVGDTLECYVVEGIPVAAKEEVQTEDAALSDFYFIIAGMNTDGNYIVLDEMGCAFYLNGEQIAKGLPEDSEDPLLGDVIRFRGNVCFEQTNLAGDAVNSMHIIVFDDDFYEYPIEHGMILKTDSVLDDMETAEYQVGVYGWDWLSLNDDENSYPIVTCWQRDDRYQRIGNLDWEEVEPGDTLKCIVYDGRPVIALEEVVSVPDDGRTWVIGDTFRYSVYERTDNKGNTYYSGGVLESDVNANFIVTGTFYKEGEDTPCKYTLNALTKFGEKSLQLNAGENDLDYYLNGQTLKPGDLLHIDNGMIAEVYPACLHLEEDTSVEILGSGVDIFGEAFKRVLYYEMYDEPIISASDTPLRESGYIYELYDQSMLDTGNLNNDDSINLLDVVTLNKNLMTGFPIGSYAKGCADVDRNGEVNAVDSLNILKYSIGLIESFEEIQ